MVAVAMRRIDGNQILLAFLDPFGQFSIVFDGDECIDQNGILPAEMSVDDIGDHLRSVTPGGKSAVTTWGWVLTKTSQFNELFILRLRLPHDVKVCVGRT